MLSLQDSKTNVNVVWEPLPGSQELALDSRAGITLFTGTRGPGKTDCQLMRFRRRVGQGYGHFWRGVIFDREYKNLDDIVSKSKRWFTKFNDGAHFHESSSMYKWEWPTGEELLFRTLKKDSDYNNFHGQEFPFIGWNELTKYPNRNLYDLMMSCNRSSFTPEKDSPITESGKRHLLKQIPLEIFATTNSWGSGHWWVKQEFIDPAPYGKVVRKTIRVFNPQTQCDEDVVTTQVAIFGSYRENKYLDKQYIARLHEMCSRNANLRKSWLEGDWNVVAGGAFDDVWVESVHVLPRFKIPETWHIDRSFDWGSSKPFSVGWWAEANGDEATLEDGTKFCPAPGSLIRLSEWYGTEKLGTNKGLKMSAGKVADGIKEREIEMMRAGWIPYQPWPGPADNSIRDVRESDEDTIEEKMAKKGVRWTESDKSPGSRRNGFQLFRDRLEAAIDKEGQAVYFMDNCRAAIAMIPVLPRDEVHIDDVDTDAEDHPWDDTRYRILKGSNRAAKSLPVAFVN